MNKMDTVFILGWFVTWGVSFFVMSGVLGLTHPTSYVSVAFIGGMVTGLFMERVRKKKSKT